MEKINIIVENYVDGKLYPCAIPTDMDVQTAKNMIVKSLKLSTKDMYVLINKENGIVIEDEEILSQHICEGNIIVLKRVSNRAFNETNNVNIINSKSSKSHSFAKYVIIVTGLIASLILFFTGFSLTTLESVAGNSLAEAYYQSMGYISIGASFFTFALTLFMYYKVN